jgi:drug/metabolite transporter (DMT)-like permease
VLKTAGLTLAALTAFAANSILCRLALIRLASGARALWLIVLIGGRRATLVHGTWSSAGMLFVYAAAFSFAYLSLSAGTGALILFAAVQITMMAAGLRAGERLQARGWFGIALAVGGLGYLVSPGVSAPSPLGAALMATAGVAWGFYSLEGRRSAQATAATMGNFILATPFALLLSLITFAQLRLSPTGMLLALLSGAVTSGMGYVVWYAVLPTLGATRGATVQLAVPVLTALGGVMMLSEELTVRLVTSTVAIVMGIGLVLWRTERPSRDAAAH